MPSEQPLRLGLIGCGFFAQNHLNAWREIPDVTLAAVCDLDPAKAEAAAQAFGAPRWYTDAAKMLANETLDFVDVITTPPSHRPLVELAARHQVAVICQKPMAWSIEDAQTMVAACKQAGVPFMVHENFRWETPMREIRRLLDAGAIGRPFFGRLSFRTAHDVYADQPWFLATERFIVLELAVHLLDLARFLFGEPRALFCHNVQVNPAIKGEDVSTIMLTMDGAHCIVDCSFTTIDEPEPFPETFVTLEGPGGTIHLDAGYQLRVVRPGASEAQTLAIPRHSWYEPPWHVVQDSVFNIQSHWVECLRAGREPETSGADNLRVLELVFGAYESAERGAVYHTTFG
jgi:predicted dehydrogenase